jgi:uncharacterized protein YcbK (DUF882 family)
MNITENFTLEEFMHSDTAIVKGIKNDPGSREKLAITNLCAKLLQPLRDAIGKPISINSGYRCPELNAAMGGVPTSQHQKGEAADLSIGGKAGDLLEVLEDSGLPFDQAILYRKNNFLHVSLKLEGEQRKQIIIKK